MGCRRVAALHLVPLLTRLVLAAAFIPAGWGKVMGTSTVDGPEAAAIRAMLEDPWSASELAPRAASMEASGKDAETSTTDGTKAASETAAAPPRDEAASEAPLEIRQVLKLAVMLDGHDVPMPVVLAWVAALTELVGGGLLVIGLLSRLWAFGLVVAMGVAFALTSVDPILEFGPFGLGLDAYTKAVAQLSLGTLALGLLLTGPGGLAIDHAIFGADHRADDFDDDHDDD